MPRTKPPLWTDDRPTRLRLALVLLVTLVAILASKFWEESYIETLQRDCGSLFDDRLMPATLLFHLVDEMHLKRETLQRHLTSERGGEAGDVQYTMGQHDARMQEFINQIGQTYLVDAESRHLASLRTALTAYRNAEQALIQQHARGEVVSYSPSMRQRFSDVHDHLMSLSADQQTVGAALKRESVTSTTSMSLLLSFQLGAAFVLGLVAAVLATSLVTTARQKRGDDPNLH